MDDAPGDATAPESIAQAAKRYQPDRYLSALLAPAPQRDDLIAVAAFAGEIARIPALVSEPLLGEMRLAWWRDALTGTGPRRPTGNPIADALVTAIGNQNAPPDWADGIIDGVVDTGRAALYGQPPADDDAMIDELKSFEGGLFALASALLGHGEPEVAKSACQAAGGAYGLARLIQDLPRQLARGHVPLPRARVEKYGIDFNALAAGELSRSAPGSPAGRPAGEPVAALLAGLRDDARALLVPARKAAAQIAWPARGAFLPLALVEPYLRISERQPGNPLAQSFDVMPLTRIWRIWRARLARPGSR